MFSVLKYAAPLSLFASYVAAQQVGTLTAETHPALNVQTCTKAGGCTTVAKSVTLDANWRWTHSTANSTNCYTGNTWDANLCPNPTACAANCAIDGADYSGTYGITTSGNSLNLKFVTVGPYSTNIGSRVYLMNTDTSYQMFQLKNREFTFDVNVNNLGCGLNGALYFVEMDADGGLAKYPGNKAGAKYGTGYCDAQCPHDIKFINGEANVQGWTPSSNDVNAGSGTYGSCCNEMDIWEANKFGSAYTPHPCSVNGQTRCSGTACGDDATGERYSGVCDKDGCDINTYRNGVKGFYGPGLVINTNAVFTVVTQFITADGTDTGDLSEIRRYWVQNGVTYETPYGNFSTIAQYNSISDGFCSAQKTLFGDSNQYAAKGGLKVMGDALARGVVLVMSLWDDHAANMLWLDSSYPLNKDPSVPGVARGPCATTSGVPSDVEAQQPNANVAFSNIKWGELGSTFNAPASSSTTTTRAATTTTTTRASTSTTTTRASTSTTTTRASTTSTTTTRASTTSTTTTRATTTTTTAAASPTACAVRWGQCGGTGFTGPTTCCDGYTCTVGNPYYSQCL